jgi:hypothetical protein
VAREGPRGRCGGWVAAAPHTARFRVRRRACDRGTHSPQQGKSASGEPGHGPVPSTAWAQHTVGAREGRGTWRAGGRFSASPWAATPPGPDSPPPPPPPAMDVQVHTATTLRAGPTRVVAGARAGAKRGQLGGGRRRGKVQAGCGLVCSPTQSRRLQQRKPLAEQAGLAHRRSQHTRKKKACSRSGAVVRCTVQPLGSPRAASRLMGTPTRPLQTQVLARPRAPGANSQHTQGDIEVRGTGQAGLYRGPRAPPGAPHTPLEGEGWSWWH